MKKYLPILCCALIALGFTYFTNDSFFKSTSVNADVEIEKGIIEQKIVSKTTLPHTVTKIYHSGKLIGVFTDRGILDNLLNEIYNQNYSDIFPNSSLNLSPDLYFTEQSSYFNYENKDDLIINYIKNNDLFAIEVNRVEFSNGVIVYVKNIDDFNTAKDQYLLNYVDRESLILIQNNQLPAELTTYGERILDIQVAETYVITKGFAALEDVMMNVQDVLEFFSYGYETEKKTYVTEEYDTVEWVASQNNLSAQQLITLNSEVLKSETQLLEKGLELNVTYFKSPINIIVTKERIAKEVVYAGSTIYRANSSIREGMNNVVVKEENGSKNVYYHEVYINGEIYEQNIISEVITLEPIREVVEYGTKIIPGVGTGKFRYPVNNVKITCHWGCYNSPKYGFHRGVDMIDTKNRYGNIYAADRGTIEKVGYSDVNGYYVYINHNNGYRTYYGHMSSKCYFPVGTNVEKGEVIGKIGQTGAATGPHVHFIILKGNERYDACKWLGC